MILRYHSRFVLLVLLVAACGSVTTWAVHHAASLSLLPTPVARGGTLTISVTLDSDSPQVLSDTTLLVPLPVGIDQWQADVRIDGGPWFDYPANGIISLDPIAAYGTMLVDILVPVETASPATLSIVAQWLDSGGILADAAGLCNVLPSVDAGPDRIVDLGADIVLSDASASDGGGPITAYAWTDHGAGGSFTASGVLNASYLPPQVSGVVEISLTVTDPDGGASADSLRVRVNAVPTVDLGDSIEAEEGERVSIWQADVSDPDGWLTQIAWNDGGAGGTFLPSVDVIDPVYVVPAIDGCEDVSITLTLEVTDDWGAVGSDALELLILNSNEPPTVHLPVDFTVTSGERVELSAIAADDDGWVISSGWEQRDGIPVQLEFQAQTTSVAFVAPPVGIDQTLVFRFLARDNCGGESWQEVLVTVTSHDGAGTAPIEDGSLLVRLEVFDDRGFPATPFDAPTPGEELSLRISVLNRGGSEITDLYAESEDGTAIPLLADFLPPWGSTSGEASWTPADADVADGLEITVTVMGIDSVGRRVAASDHFSFASSATEDTPALALTIVPSVMMAMHGETVTFVYQLVNRGNQDVVGLTLIDSRLGRIDLPSHRLDAGGTANASGTYTVLVRDGLGMLLANATATGFTATGERIEATASVEIGVAATGGGGGSISALGSLTGEARRVVISEIAWAGSAHSERAEWVELANTGPTSVDLTGWQLCWFPKTGITPPRDQWQCIDLVGEIHPLMDQDTDDQPISFDALENGLLTIRDARWTLPGKQDGIYLIERASDATVGNAPADLVYGDEISSAMDLPDTGATLFLVDSSGAIVDSANAQYPDRQGWPAGNLHTKASMERIDLDSGDFDANWQSCPGILVWGTDESGRGLRATPGQPNSFSLEVLLSHAAAYDAAVPLAESGIIPLPDAFSTTRPAIQLAAMAGAGGGGATAFPELSTTRRDGALSLEVNGIAAAPGLYVVWITAPNGQTLVLPLAK